MPAPKEPQDKIEFMKTHVLIEKDKVSYVSSGNFSFLSYVQLIFM